MKLTLQMTRVDMGTRPAYAAAGFALQDVSPCIAQTR